MDEGKNVQAIMVLVVLLCAVGHASAKSSFGICFFGCAVTTCLIAPQKLVCVGKCFAQCLFRPSPLGLDDCKHKYNCAVDQCARLITDDFKLEDVEKVIECVDGCDGNANQCGALGPISSMSLVSSSNKP